MSVPREGMVDGSLGDGDASARRIQDIASEVLRLRLVQSQHRQLEGQLKAAVEKLHQTEDKVGNFSHYLEQGLRPGGSVGTLGGSFAGVEPDSLLGLMECLCVVCNAPLSSRKQEELLAATLWLLQDPKALLARLSGLPPAPSLQTRRLAPYLLSCEGSWRGHLTEAGQCYEALRSWLSCYYQFSLVSDQMEANAAQLRRQEQLLTELSKEDGAGPAVEPALSLGEASRNGKGSGWRSLKRSSSVQSTSSAGSRRSQSPDVSRLVNGKIAGAGSTCSLRRREASLKSPPSSRGRLDKPVEPASLKVAPVPQAATATARLEKRPQGEPSPRVSRLVSHLPMSTVLGGRASRSGSAAAPPGPPVVTSPRRPYSARDTEPKTVLSTRRHIVPAVRARRSPSREVPVAGPAFGLSRLTPAIAVKRLEENQEKVPENGAPLSPRTCSALCRSRSLHSITEPPAQAIGTISTPLRPRPEATARRSQITPSGRLSTSASQPQRTGAVTVRTSRLHAPVIAAPGAISTISTVRLQRRGSILPARAGQDSALRAEPMARDLTPSAWALATSRSSPSLETRLPHPAAAAAAVPVGRQVPGSMVTPRPLFSARAR
ncbi:unnamed protein product [Effrenium voratum]|nr:unnamed protein product [Effrenium voratum]